MFFCILLKAPPPYPYPDPYYRSMFAPYDAQPYPLQPYGGHPMVHSSLLLILVIWLLHVEAIF
jgi:hypothetical protein